MTDHPQPGALRRTLRFAAGAAALAITVVLVLGVFLAAQSKLPVAFDNPVATENPGSAPASRTFELSLPLAWYGGIALVRIEHHNLPPDSRIEIRRGEATIARAYMRSAVGRNSARPVELLLRPGSLASGSLCLEVLAPVPLAAEAGIDRVLVSFPKVGSWLVPDPLVWLGVVVLGWLLGLCAAALWGDGAAARACFAVIAFALVVAVHLFGLQFAARLAFLAPTPLVLLVALLLLARGR